MKQKFDGIFEVGRALLTENLGPGTIHFEEEIRKEKGREFRVWDPRKSKLAAALAKGLNIVPIKRGDAVLYLGAAHGYTVSFISDIVGKEGFVFAIDFAPRVVRELVFVAEKRKNIAPMLEDANQPESYKEKIPKVDVVYQDVAQRNQAEILLKNAGRFLKPNGYALFAVKARSIDSVRDPSQIYLEVKEALKENFRILDYRKLDPFQRDHAFFVCQKK